MFVELMPILADRTVMITIARLNDDAIRVNVLPQRTGESENAALATPFTITGTAAELDAEVSVHLLGYVDAHRQLRTTLSEVKAQMDAAVRVAQEEGRRRTAERNKKPEGNGSEEGKGAEAEKPTHLTAETSSAAKTEPAPNLFGH